MKRSISHYIASILYISILGFFPFHGGYAAPSGEKGSTLSLSLNEKGVAAIQSKNFEKALELFRKSLAADPKNITAAHNLAGTLLNQNKMEEAITLLIKYTTDVKDDAGLFVKLGDAYFSTKKITEACKAYEKASALAPNYTNLPQKLGTIYALMHRLPEAEKMLTLAVNQNPQNAEIIASLSGILLANHKPEEAVRAAKLAINLKADPAVYKTMGVAYETLNDLENAKIAYQRASDLGDTSPELKKKLAELAIPHE